MKKQLLSFLKDLSFVVIGAYLGAYASGDLKVDPNAYAGTGSILKAYLNATVTLSAWQLILYIVIYLLISMSIKHFRKKQFSSPIWSEQVGRYSFRELSELLKHEDVNLPFQEQIPKERHNLYHLFQDYYSYMRRGVYCSDNQPESDMLIELLGPRWADYNLLVVEPYINAKRYEYHDTRLYLTTIGEKLYSLMQRSEVKN